MKFFSSPYLSIQFKNIIKKSINFCSFILLILYPHILYIKKTFLHSYTFISWKKESTIKKFSQFYVIMHSFFFNTLNRLLALYTTELYLYYYKKSFLVEKKICGVWYLVHIFSSLIDLNWSRYVKKETI